MPETLITWNCPFCTRHLGGVAIVHHPARKIIAAALHMAAQQYAADASTNKAAAEEAGAGHVGDGHRRIAEQFERQAEECEQLANRLD